MAKVIDLIDDLKSLIAKGRCVEVKISDLENERAIIDSQIRHLKDDIIGQIEEEQLD